MNKNCLFYSWLAGFWEGEGCLIKGKRGYRVQIVQSIQINKTTKQMMKEIQFTFKGKLYFIKSKDKRRKNQYRWALVRYKDMLRFLIKIYPYCYLRKQDVKVAIDFLKQLKLKHFRDYEKYLYKIKKYINLGYTYKQISVKLKNQITISDSTICRIVEKYNLLN